MDKAIRHSTWRKEKRRTGQKRILTYGIILRILFWSGIDVSGEKKKCTARYTLSFIFPILMHSTYVDYWLMSYASLKRKWFDYQVVVSYIASNTLSLLLWYILFMRRKNLEALLRNLETFSGATTILKPLQKMCFNVIIVVGIVFLPVIYSLLSVFLMNYCDPGGYYTFFTYGHKVDNFTLTWNVYLFAKTLASITMDPIFTGIATALYCIFCFRCYRLMASCRQKLTKMSLGRSLPSNLSLTRVARDFTGTVRFLEQLQDVFSLPSFILVLVNFLSSFTTLASALLYSLEERTPPVTTENTFVFVNSAFLLTATIALAAQIPITMTEIHNCCQRLSEKLVWRFGDCATGNSRMHALKIMQDIPVFVLSGCDIIYFRRSAILTALGTLFTYGLLVIQNR